jgi:hypothetical protein
MIDLLKINKLTPPKMAGAAFYTNTGAYRQGISLRNA